MLSLPVCKMGITLMPVHRLSGALRELLRVLYRVLSRTPHTVSIQQDTGLSITNRGEKPVT